MPPWLQDDTAPKRRRIFNFGLGGMGKPSLITLNKAHKANDASSWWHNDCMVTWLHEIILDLLWLWLVQIDIPGCITDRSMDWQTDGPVDRLIELRRFSKRASYTSYDNILLKNVDFPCFWRKRDGRTDRPYRDAKTHLKSAILSRAFEGLINGG